MAPPSTGATCWRPLTTYVPRPGTSWRGPGIAFTRNQVVCTLLARWEDGYQEPWQILTDLPPAASDAGWYGLRAWIEQGFKITKRAGWQWHRPRMTDPARATRLRLVSVLRQGWVRLLMALLRQDPLPEGRLVPEPWPVVPPLEEEARKPAMAMPHAA